MLSDQPKPKGPLPLSESYASESCSPKLPRLMEVALGTVMGPVPVTGLAGNFDSADGAAFGQ